MKNLIEILPNVYGVKVPKYYIQGQIEKWYNEYFLKYAYKNEKFDTLSDEIRLGENNFKILGTLTKDEISFDASEVVLNLSEDDEMPSYPFYEKRKGKNAVCFNPERSFRSALHEEIYFENPFKEPSTEGFDLNDMYDWNLYYEDCEQYQTAQENITEKLLILQKL